MSEEKDSRIFPPEIAEKSEPERFHYYYEKATNALHNLDTQRRRNEIERDLREDLGSLGHSVKWWREHQEQGPPKRARENDIQEVKDDLAIAFKSYNETLSHLEASIGRAFLQAIETGDNEPIESARKAIQAKREWKGDKRILHRRIVRTLAGFFFTRNRVPTKGELFEALDDYPIGEASVVVTRKTLRVATRHDTAPRKVSKGNFSDALANLALSDLPENRPGNPNLSNRSDVR